MRAADASAILPEQQRGGGQRRLLPFVRSGHAAARDSGARFWAIASAGARRRGRSLSVEREHPVHAARTAKASAGFVQAGAPIRVASRVAIYAAYAKREQPIALSEIGFWIDPVLGHFDLRVEGVLMK